MNEIDPLSSSRCKDNPQLM